MARKTRKKEVKKENTALPKESVSKQVTDRMKHLFGEEKIAPIKLPHLRAKKPHEIKSINGNVMIINSPLIGSLTAEDEYTDIVKNSLRLAEVSKCDAVIITGNLMYMLAQRYGTRRPYKTQVSGIKVDSKKVEAGYPQSVVKHPEFRPIEKRLEKGELVFMTLGQRLEHNLDMLHKSFVDENNKPLYSGSVYITFGKLEDELIMFYVNEFLRVDLFKSKAWAQKIVAGLTSAWRKEKDKDKKESIYQELMDWKRWLNIFVVLSNSADESIDRKREIVAALLVRKYEESIPNGKVISVGDAFIKMGSRTIMITADKQKNESKGKLSALLLDKTESYSKGRNPDSIPNVMLGMGLNPFLDVRFVTYQASDKPKDKRMCTIIQLPPCLDSERYRDVIRNQNLIRDQITRVGQESGFESGIVVLRWREELAQPIIESWTSDILKNKSIFTSRENINAVVNGKKTENKILYAHKKGCTHYGASDIMFYESPNDKLRPLKYHNQVAMEFLLAADAPILMDQHDGDITQGANHPYWKNVHPEYLLPEDFLDKMNEIEALDISWPAKLDLIKKLALEQKIFEGVLQIDEQIRGYAKSVNPYLEYFANIIIRKKKVGLVFKGRVGSIVKIMGNHCKNTYKKSDIFVSDALHITEQIKKELFAYLMERNARGITKQDIESEMVAPQHGPLGEARGSFGVDGYQRYTVVLKHKQGEIDKTQKKSQKRSMNEYEVGLPIVNLSGDNHKGGIRITRGIVNIKTGGQQDEGSYGREIDGSEQNVFSLVYGVPVGGFMAGPVVFIVLDVETMRNYAAKPFPIDGKELFRNALK